MEKEFLKIFEENKSRIIRICMFYEKNSESRKDLYQEIAYQVWRSLKGFKNKSDIKTWLYRIAINTAISFRRKNLKAGLKSPLEYFYKLKSPNNLESETETNELLQIIYRAIEELNKIEQTVILLFLEGFSYKEIADITGFTQNNITVKMNRIKNKLRELVEV